MSHKELLSGRGSGVLSGGGRQFKDCAYSFQQMANGHMELQITVDLYQLPTGEIDSMMVRRGTREFIRYDLEDEANQASLLGIIIYGCTYNLGAGSATLQGHADRFCQRFEGQAIPERVEYALVNFIFEPCKYTFYGKHRFNLNRMDVGIGDCTVVFVQTDDYSEKMQRIKKTLYEITATASITLDGIDLQQADTLIDNIVDLCSLARGNRVRWITKRTFKEEGKLIFIEAISVPTKPFRGARGAVDNCHSPTSPDLKILIETCWSRYRQLKDELNLALLINYVLDMLLQEVIQVGFILGCIFFECLKAACFRSQYGKSIETAVAQMQGGKTFKNCLRAISSEFGINFTEADLDFIKLRDEIIHTGDITSISSFEGKANELFRLENMVDRAMLRILGYDGYYFDKTQHNKRVKLP